MPNTNLPTHKPHIYSTEPISQELGPGIYAICSCGWSCNQPFCDGSHEGTGLNPVKMTVSERKRFNFCTCKQSAAFPLCDTTHERIIEEMKAQDRIMLP